MLLAIFPEPLLLCSCANYFVRAESFVRFSCPVLSRVETWLSAAVLTGYSVHSVAFNYRWEISVLDALKKPVYARNCVAC